jgi:chitinase
MTPSSAVLAPPVLPQPAPVDRQPDDGTPSRLSWSRLGGVLLALAALIGAGGVLTTRSLVEPPPPVASGSWFAPYIDATLTPLFQFQNPYVNPARQSVLGFVVADPQRPCEPSWGAAYDLDQADSDLNLDRRIAQVQAHGGDLMVSFGGVAHDDLATACKDSVQLAAAYSQVISRYKVTTVDLDVEGEALGGGASARRAKAMADLQRQAQAAGRRLEVWLTLPVARTGLTDEALSVVRRTLAAGVRLAGVNVMAMDYSSPVPDMGDAVHASLLATHQQLIQEYPATSADGADPDEVWHRLGVTVMIGQNDSAGEAFTVADAKRLVNDTRQWRLGRVSMWSLNRDRGCSRSFSVIVHSNLCSGIDQASLAFAGVFAGLAGAAPTPSDAPSVHASVIVDNPATSPYPLWRPGRAYVAGYKVVRSGNVYQARWFSRGSDPAAPIGRGAQKAWTLLGPVLPGDHPTPPTPMPDGTYPKWSAKELYPLGSRVLFDHLPYQAKWQNKAASPRDEDVDPSVSAWQPLFTIPGEPAES